MTRPEDEPDRKGPRWERRKDDRPGEILDAALAVFTEKGFSNARLDDIAARAGVSKGTLYLYFSDKEEIFRRVIEHAIIPNVESIAGISDDQECTTEDLLRRVITAAAHLLGSTPMGAIPKLIIAEAGNFPGVVAFYRDRVLSNMQKIITGLLRRGIASGEFRADIDVDYAFRIIAAPVLLLALVKNVPPLDETWNIDPGRHAEAALDVLLNGLKAAGAKNNA